LAVKIRLTRMGRKKKPFYRIVVMDTRAKRDGKYIEKLGIYNPMVDPPEIQIDEERISYWIDTGALISDTVKSLMKKKGIIYKRYLKKKGLSEGEIEEEMKKWEVLQIERERRLAKEAGSKDKKKKIEEPEAEETKEEEVKEKEEVKVEEPQVEDDKAEEAKAEETEQKGESAPSEEEVKEETEPAKEELSEDKTVEPEQDTVDQQQEKDKQQEQN